MRSLTSKDHDVCYRKGNECYCDTAYQQWESLRTSGYCLGGECSCSYHRRGIANQGNSRRIRLRISSSSVAGSKQLHGVQFLPLTVSNWECRNLGCDGVLHQINSRLNTQYHIDNPDILLALRFCVDRNLDFGTAFAYVRAMSLVPVCTTSMCGSTKKAMQNFHGRNESLTSNSRDPPAPQRWELWLPPWENFYRRFHIFGYHPEFRSWWAYYEERGTDSPDRLRAIARAICEDLGYISNPYKCQPRRMWDLCSNRVIPTELIMAGKCYEHCSFLQLDRELYPYPQLGCSFWAVSHSWTAEMSNSAVASQVLTEINAYQWPVPLPVGVSLDSVRGEIVHLLTLHERKAGSTHTMYCWVDILCLRQRTKPKIQIKKAIKSWKALANIMYYWFDALRLRQWRRYFVATDKLKKQWQALETQRLEEWEVDIPTIGQIYRSAAGVVTYYNGLGMPFRRADWDSERHWLNRAWTLQEISLRDSTVTGGILLKHILVTDINLDDLNLNTISTVGTFRGKQTTLREILFPLRKFAEEAGTNRGCSILELIAEMSNRKATDEIDKIAGLNFLLNSPRLPRYYSADTAEKAWVACLHSLRYNTKLELLFNFPLVRFGHNDPMRLGDLLWTPTWQQISDARFLMKPLTRPFTLLDDQHVSSPNTTKSQFGYDRLSIKNAIILPHCQIFCHQSSQMAPHENSSVYVVEVQPYLSSNKARDYNTETNAEGGYTKYEYATSIHGEINSSSLRSHSVRSPGVLKMLFYCPMVNQHITPEQSNHLNDVPGEKEIIPKIQPGDYVLVTHSFEGMNGWVVCANINNEANPSIIVDELGKDGGNVSNEEMENDSSGSDKSVDIGDSDSDSNICTDNETENNSDPDVNGKIDILDGEICDKKTSKNIDDEVEDDNGDGGGNTPVYWLQKIGVLWTPDISILEENPDMYQRGTCHFL